MPDSPLVSHAAFRDRPVDFAREVLSLEPTEQQAAFLAALAAPSARVAMRSGHGIGKSTALAAAAIWFLATRPEAVIPCTAPTAHQLSDVLWREIRRLVGRIDGPARAEFQLTSERVLLREGSGMIVARTSRPENPDALQGFHAEELLFVIDEAAGVANPIFEVARGALSTPHARVALAGNPTRLDGYFHTAFHSARASWNRMAFSSADSPLVSPDYPKEIAGEYGEDSDMYRVRVLGEFPKRSMESLIHRDLVEAALERGRQGGLPALPDTPLIIGVDPAWRGPDRSAAVLRRGPYAKVLFAERGADTVRVARLVMRHATDLRADAIFVDQTGYGAGVFDQLRRTGHPVTGIHFGGAALQRERFANHRAEMWWNVHDWLKEGAALDAAEYANDFLTDLCGPEPLLTMSGKIILESKDDMRRRGLSSPDLGDALALTFAMDVVKRSPALDAAGPFVRRDYAYDWMQRNEELGIRN